MTTCHLYLRHNYTTEWCVSVHKIGEPALHNFNILREKFKNTRPNRDLSPSSSHSFVPACHFFYPTFTLNVSNLRSLFFFLLYFTLQLFRWLISKLKENIFCFLWPPKCEYCVVSQISKIAIKKTVHQTI